MSRVRTWKNEKELKERIEDYFKWAKTHNKPLSVARLALYLGMSRQEVVDYSQDKYLPYINYAKDVILADMEERMTNGDGSVNGITFLIKNNFNYKDKKTHEGHITHEGFVRNMLEKAQVIDV